MVWGGHGVVVWGGHGVMQCFFLENSPRGGKMEIFGFEGGQSELDV